MKKTVRTSLSIRVFLDFMHTDLQWKGDRMSSGSFTRNVWTTDFERRLVTLFIKLEHTFVSPRTNRVDLLTRITSS